VFRRHQPRPLGQEERPAQPVKEMAQKSSEETGTPANLPKPTGLSRAYIWRPQKKSNLHKLGCNQLSPSGVRVVSERPPVTATETIPWQGMYVTIHVSRVERMWVFETHLFAWKAKFPPREHPQKTEKVVIRSALERAWAFP
jgi:hypothetical protein